MGIKGLTTPWKEFGYWWFRWGKKLRGPYLSESLAKKAIRDYERRRGDLEEEWKKVL